MPPLHTAQAVHEVVVEAYHILDSVNCELATYTLADWVRLFETRFSLSVEHLRQRFPQETGSLLSVLAHVPSGDLASLSETAHSPWSPRQVASDALLASSRAWYGSAFCSEGLAEGNASLARSSACLLALPAPFVSALLSGRVKLWASFWPFFLLIFRRSTDVGTAQTS